MSIINSNSINNLNTVEKVKSSLNSTPDKKEDIKNESKPIKRDSFETNALVSYGIVPLKDNAIKEIIKSDNITQESKPEKSETSLNEKGNLAEPTDSKNTEPKDDKSERTKDINTAITATQTIISIVGGVAKLTKQDDQFSDLLSSSSGALSASQAIIEMKDSSKAQDIDQKKKVKQTINSISQIASGVGSIMAAANLPQADLINLTGNVTGLAVAQDNMNENIKKKDPKAIAQTTISIAKTAWATTVSGVNTAKFATSLGVKYGFVKQATLDKVTLKADKISNVTDKLAIPFALASTTFSYFDWEKSKDKLSEKQAELAKFEKEHEGEDKESKVIKRPEKNSQEVVLKESVKTLETNSSLMGLSLGSSVISTASLVASVVFPQSTSITQTVAIVGSVTSSILSTLSSDKNRDAIENVYENIRDKYQDVEYELDKLIFAGKKQV